MVHVRNTLDHQDILPQ